MSFTGPSPPSTLFYAFGQPLKIVVETGLTNRSKLIRTLRAGGAQILERPEDAKILLVDEDSPGGQSWIQDWDDDKVILQYRWAGDCVKAGRLLLREDECGLWWGLSPSELGGASNTLLTPRSTPSDLNSHTRNGSEHFMDVPPPTPMSAPGADGPAFFPPSSQHEAHANAMNDMPFPHSQPPTFFHPSQPNPPFFSQPLPATVPLTQPQSIQPPLSQPTSTMMPPPSTQQGHSSSYPMYQMQPQGGGQLHPEAFAQMMAANPPMAQLFMNQVINAMNMGMLPPPGWPGLAQTGGPLPMPFAMGPVPMPLQYAPFPQSQPGSQSGSQASAAAPSPSPAPTPFQPSWADSPQHSPSPMASTRQHTPREDSPEAQDLSASLSRRPSSTASISTWPSSSKGKARESSRKHAPASSASRRASPRRSDTMDEKPLPKKRPSMDSSKEFSTGPAAGPSSSRKRETFESKPGVPLKIYVHLDGAFKERKRIVAMIKSGKGTIAHAIEDSDCVVLYRKAKSFAMLFARALSSARAKTPVVLPAFITDSVAAGTLLDHAGYLVEPPAGKHKVAVRGARVKREATPEGGPWEERSAVADVEEEALRVPSPPLPASEPQIVRVAGQDRHVYTAADRAYAKAYLPVLFCREPNVTYVRLADLLHAKMPSHPVNSWGSFMDRNRDDVDKCRKEGMAMRRSLRRQSRAHPKDEEVGESSSTKRGGAGDGQDSHEVSSADMHPDSPKELVPDTTVNETSSALVPDVPNTSDAEKPSPEEPDAEAEDIAMLVDFLANRADLEMDDDGVWAVIEAQRPCRTAPSWDKFYSMHEEKVFSAVDAVVQAREAVQVAPQTN